MKLHVLSDLHLSFGPMARPASDADVVVLAGDIARSRAAAEWAQGFGKPVLYVLGNHEYYGASLAGAMAELKGLCQGSDVHVLDAEEIVLDGVRFLGATLWSDFDLFGPGEKKAAAMAAAQHMLRDFSAIRTDEAGTLFTPAHSAALFRRHAAWLNEKLATPHAGPTVVITHHAPSPRSVHPRFAESPLNACFVSDLERLLGAGRVALWIHGHTHDSFDYRVNGTRVLCNPRGYAREGVNENASFDPGLTVEV
ncbi:metallophosphoesterase [Ramlibacter solisilvae]|uniref:Metallophosphoesterase n=1 Tax=Ramlibacter tataouinensis TaxID=94132 RepID=A0A127K032_9BURK|nr:metallophosphoesterase [Ramlibacter tataouinensis]AMO23752.1 metallophosphoesterase [Ramlibacter tataouinensis]